MTGADPLEAAAFVTRLKSEGLRRYHDRHPFHRRMHDGELSPAELRAWVANRYYYQTRIPIKDAIILSKSDDLPRSCMDGWARRYVVVAPDGLALPCHGARELPLPAASVTDAPLADIWLRAPMFRAFRGSGWMREPCRSCERREVDFGGCRCQAFALTGEAAATDPACSRAPAHAVVARARATAGSHELASRPITLRRPPRGTRQA